MAGATLTIDHHDALGFAPLGPAALAAFHRFRLQVEQRAQGDPHDASAADAQQVAPGHFKVCVAEVAEVAACAMNHRVTGGMG